MTETRPTVRRHAGRAGYGVLRSFYRALGWPELPSGRRDLDQVSPRRRPAGALPAARPDRRGRARERVANEISWER
jgi:hypothetical protein